MTPLWLYGVNARGTTVAADAEEKMEETDAQGPQMEAAPDEEIPTARAVDARDRSGRNPAGGTSADRSDRAALAVQGRRKRHGPRYAGDARSGGNPRAGVTFVYF